MTVTAFSHYNLRADRATLDGLRGSPLQTGKKRRRPPHGAAANLTTTA
jgi:hypothetical protein